MTLHRLEAIQEGNKRVRGTICRQAWGSSDKRSACPGAPVYAFEELPSSLKTPPALWCERKIPPDLDKPDGAYRILKAPYFRLVYDERKAIAQPLTEKQLAATAKQRATMRTRYGCRLCDTYYRKEDQQWFKGGVCSRCQSAARSWNYLIAWARHMAQEEPLILDIFTEPAGRPVAWTGRAPDISYNEATNKHLIEWWKPETYLLTSYQVMNLVTGEPERKVDALTNEGDIFELRHLIGPRPSVHVPSPLILMASAVARDIAHRGAFAGVRKGELNPNLETLPLAYHYQAQTGRTWTRILEVDSRGNTERDHLAYAVRTYGLTVESTESTATLLQRFVLHLAAQEPLVIEESEERA